MESLPCAAAVTTQRLPAILPAEGAGDVAVAIPSDTRGDKRSKWKDENLFRKEKSK